MKFGVLVIGQSPRPEVEEEIKLVSKNSYELDLRGALDGLSKQEINDLTPINEEDTLFTRLPDGSPIIISKKAVTRYGQKQLEVLVDSHSNYVVVLCTGDFPEWNKTFRIIYPSKILKYFVNSIQRDGSLGVFVPLIEQSEKIKLHWTSLGYDVTIIPLSPNASKKEILRAGDKMSFNNPELMVFDCVSYRTYAKNLILSKVKKPAILAISVIARCLSEIIIDQD